MKEISGDDGNALDLDRGQSYICQNSTNVLLRFLYCIVCKFYFEGKRTAKS
jgi:hypothetical protein